MSHCLNTSRNTMNYRQINAPSPHPRQLFVEWYHSTPSGQTLRKSEAAYLLNRLQLTYCQRILQVGRLGTEFEYISEEYSRNFALLIGENEAAVSKENMIRGTPGEWPIACESVDTLILPHLIEFETDPHRALSEAKRVLKPEGRLFVLGFNPWSLQGLLPYRQPPTTARNTHFVSCHQIMYWLSLLKFEAEFSAGFGFPSTHAFIEPQSIWLKSMAHLTPAYAVKAIKRTWTPIPAKPVWRNAPDLLPGHVIAPPLVRKQQ